MLELRPACEHCNRPLPPDTADAMICSYECTFCRACVEGVLAGACPNCGGGFVPRPVRPARDWVGGNCLTRHPAGTRVVHKPVDGERQAALLARLQGVPPEQR
jgi:hypothetical protein